MVPSRDRQPETRRRVLVVAPDVVGARIDTHRLEALQIDLLNFVGRRLENHLKLMMLEDAIGILAEPAVIGAPRRLHVRHVPRFWAEYTQQRLGMGRAGADLEVERLLNDASLRRPEGA